MTAPVLSKLTEAQREWLDAILDIVADDLYHKAVDIKQQLNRHPNGRIRVALHPQMVAYEALAEWLPTAGRAALKESKP